MADLRAASCTLIAFCSLAAAATSASSSESFETQCKAIASADFSTVTDAPTQITEAVPIHSSDELPAHCRVQGYVVPSVGFEIVLPAENWNGKFLEIGCGGLCGTTRFVSVNSELGCGYALRKGYACIGTDMGHHGPGATWANNNLQAEIDYSFRAPHVSALAGKAITARYYGSAPVKSYFTGCSSGGRAALVVAQRFPWDFDGIVAMDPAIDFTEVAITLLWNYLAVRDKDGKAVFTDADIRTLHGAVVDKCDLNDGVTDGLIGDPRDCKFDPAELACAIGAKEGCFSPEKIAAAKKVYNGPTTSSGQKITQGGVMLGAEHGIVGMANFQPGSSTSTAVTDFFRFMAFLPDAGSTWEPKDFDFDRDYKRVAMMEALYASANPDLRKFKAKGGKLILSQGWLDGGWPFAFTSIDYYETTEKTMGGRAATEDFFRMFMVPGRDHCGSGDGAWIIDHLGYLEAWVEKGQAPEMMLGYHPRDPKNLPKKFPPAAAEVHFSRPVYPYPLKARYKGSGDVNSASSFKPVQP